MATDAASTPEVPAAETAPADTAAPASKTKKRKRKPKPPRGGGSRAPRIDNGPPRFDVAELAALSGPPLWQAVHPAVVQEVTEVAVFVEVRADGHEPLRAAVPATDFAGEVPASGAEISVRLLDPPRGTAGEAPVAEASYVQAKELSGLDAVVAAAGGGASVGGVVVHEVKGGYAVALGAADEDHLEGPGVLRAFLPRSQATHSKMPRSKVVGQADQFDVTELEIERANVVVSRKARLAAEARKRAAEFWDTVKEGDKVEGVVRALVPYGAFLDVGGVDALLHASDLSWERQPKVADVLTAGQHVEVVVIQADRDKKKLKVGLKQLTPDPWKAAREAVEPGNEIEGDIVALTDFGAFVKLESGLEGLIHLSEMSWERVKHPSHKFKIGQRVKAKVLDTDFENHRISLSTKALEANPFELIAEKYPDGSHAPAKVKSLTDFGAFVELEDGVEGLVHIGELSWTERINHPSEVLTIGQEVEVVVMSVDVARQRVSCSIKRLEDNPWEDADRKFARGTRHKLPVVRVSDRGVYLQLAEGLVGYCPARELSTDPVSRAQDHVKVGDELEVEVKNIDRKTRRIALSARAVVEGETRDAYKEYKRKEREHGGGNATFGDALKGALGGLKLPDQKAKKKADSSDE